VRRVVITGTPPSDWMAEAEAITNQLRAATTEEERKQIIEDNQDHWRDDRIRNWLLEQFNNKCWYTEAYDSVSPYPVDHYRPKGRVKDLNGNTSEGYWWLAFDWNNYRICGWLINSKKVDLFPVEGVRVTSPNSPLDLEFPVLIDPITDQANLITYEKDEDACIAVPVAGINTTENDRVDKTINILGLNRLGKLNRKRADFWDKCLSHIEEYKQYKNDENAKKYQALTLIYQTNVLKRLKGMIDYSAEFSSIAEACIRKNAPDSLIAEVLPSTPNNNP